MVHPAVSKALFWPTFLWNAMLGRVLKRRRWWSRVEPNILLGAMPMRSDIPSLAQEGVTAVINMCKEYPGPVDLYQQYGIEQLWLPTVDFNPPTLEHVREGVEFIESKISNGGIVYVHCKAGRARSANIVLCYLMKYRKLSAEQAQALLLERRPHVLKKLTQREVVKEFAAELE